MGEIYLEIGGVSMAVVTADPSFKLHVPAETKGFLADQGEPDTRVSVGWRDLSRSSWNEKIFDSNALWQLYRQNESYHCSFTSPIFGPVPYKVASFNLDFTCGEVFLHGEYFDKGRSFYPLEYPLDELLLLNLLSQGRGAEIHGCGVVDAAGHGHLFAGQSGAGKSTMARLWQERKDARVLSDDRIVLRKANGKIWIYGTPWHGDAGSAAAARAPLSRIYFLRHEQENELIPTREAEAVGRLLACSFPPFYSPKGLRFTLGFLEEVVKAVGCFELGFVPDERVISALGEIEP